MGRHLDHMEVFLGNKMAFHSQTKLIAPWCGKDQGGDVDTEVRNLEAVSNDNIRKRGAADQLLIVEIDQIDIEMIRTFRVRQAKVQSHLLMLERKGDGLKMRENADQAFLFREAVLDDLVTDEKSLDARLDDVRHSGIV